MVLCQPYGAAWGHDEAGNKIGSTNQEPTQLPMLLPALSPPNAAVVDAAAVVASPTAG